VLTLDKDAGAAVLNRVNCSLVMHDNL
jgi:hypothetical protein